MFISFLRENGRWSLYHRVVKEENGVAICACGWEYDASLDRIAGKPELDFLICAHCNDGVPATQDELRVGGHLTQREPDDGESPVETELSNDELDSDYQLWSNM
jgi:hypothetical protein